MMRNVQYIFLAWLSFAAISCSSSDGYQADTTTKNLVVVGGGGVSDNMRTHLLEFSQKENPTVLIIPQASQQENRETRGREQAAVFTEMGVQQTLVLDLADPQQ